MCSVEIDLNREWGDLSLNHLKKNGLNFQFVEIRALQVAEEWTVRYHLYTVLKCTKWTLV